MIGYLLSAILSKLDGTAIVMMFAISLRNGSCVPSKRVCEHKQRRGFVGRISLVGVLLHVATEPHGSRSLTEANMFTVIVCGSRNYRHEHHVRRILRELKAEHRDLRIIVGSRRGADGLAYIWAKDTKTPVKVYEAEWKLYDEAAGPLRNQQMLSAENPDLVIAFPGGDGTADMVQRALAYGVEVQRKWPNV